MYPGLHHILSRTAGQFSLNNRSQPRSLPVIFKSPGPGDYKVHGDPEGDPVVPGLCPPHYPDCLTSPAGPDWEWSGVFSVWRVGAEPAPTAAAIVTSDTVETRETYYSDIMRTHYTLHTH